jgi:hypothetical protein
MSVWTGRMTLATAGTQTFSLGSFQPTWAHFDSTGVSARVQISHGNVDGGRQNNGGSYSDSSGSLSWDDNTACVVMYDRVAGSIVKVLEAQFMSFSIVGGIGQITYNVLTPNSTIKATILCGN